MTYNVIKKHRVYQLVPLEGSCSFIALEYQTSLPNERSHICWLYGKKLKQSPSDKKSISSLPDITAVSSGAKPGLLSRGLDVSQGES